MITNDIMISISKSVQTFEHSFKIIKNRPIWRIRIQKIKKIWEIGKQ
jgi:hypothetical protein